MVYIVRIYGIIQSNEFLRFSTPKITKNSVVDIMRTEKELDFLEAHIPTLAESAFKKAYLDALSSGTSVLEAIDGKIIEVFPDGTRKTIKKIAADRKIEIDDEVVDA